MNRIMNAVGLGGSALLLLCCVGLAFASLPTGLSFFGKAAEVYATYSSLSPSAVMAISASAHFEILRRLVESWIYLCAAGGLVFLSAAGIAQIYSRVSDALSLMSDR